MWWYRGRVPLLASVHVSVHACKSHRENKTCAARSPNTEVIKPMEHEVNISAKKNF